MITAHIGGRSHCRKQRWLAEAKAAPKHAVASRSHRSTHLGGFTLMELLVVISIIGMLMSLLLPAVQQAREAGRRTQCANNMRNISTAILLEEIARLRFPASGNFSTQGVRYHSWVVTILPYLEKRDIQSKWDFHSPVDVAPNAALSRIGISILACPDDNSVELGEGNLSYAVNEGFGFTIPIDNPATYHSALSPTPGLHAIDLSGNGAVAVSRDLLYRTSLFFVENWPHSSGTQRYHSGNSIFDGASQTILMAENVRAGYDPYTGANWAWPDPLYNAFMLSGYVCTNDTCAPGQVNYSRSNLHDGGPWQYEALNSALWQAEGQAPWPSSGHPTGVQMVFADGHLRFISDAIDGGVYAALVSPQGTVVTGSLLQQPVSETQY